MLSLLLAFVPSACALVSSDHAAEIRSVGKDVAKLTVLARQWSESGDEKAAGQAWSRILELDAKHEAAHKGLRHHLYDGRWFETYTGLYRYRREEDARMLADKGLVRFRDQWVPQVDGRYLELGFQKDADGSWCSASTLARLTRERDLTNQGYEQQDLTWIAPAEFDTWRQKLWKCGDRWLDTAGADSYHAGIPTWWEAPSERFVVCSTLGRESLEWAKWYADKTYDDLVRIFGVRPGEVPSTVDLLGPQRDKPTVVVLGSMDQYNTFAAGDAVAGLPTTELEGFSSLHYAYFASAWFDTRAGTTSYRGSGVAFWAKNDEKLAPFGQHSIRHAAAQSFVEAIDPSWAAVATARNVFTALPNEAFWAEKRIPRWLRYGAASYCERYFVEKDPGEGVDPRWARKWALENLASKGGLDPLERVFEFSLSLVNVEKSTQLVHDAGAVVAFLLDGGNRKVDAAHAAFRAALASGESTTKAVSNLQKALLESESAVQAFAKP
jgi:hypothetical protein